MPVKGDRIGPYEVLEAIGAGGMGEVYRARDTNLGREVALKILPPAVAGDPERLARFEREARTLASLNHPNIAAIYGLERSEAGPVLVLEFVDGRPLDAVARTLGIDDILAIARQIAEALEAAHEVGIIHRDLKPANVKVRNDGTVKVLDFGLAKALDTTVHGAPGTAHGAPSSAHDRTSTEHRAPSTVHGSLASTMLSPAMTAQGIILGTASYMAPEQARGRPVDRRADIWSFGVVLYELLAREQLFGGESMADVLAAVMTREPDLAKLPPDTPAAVRALVARCLERDPRQRLQSIGEARIILSNPQAPGRPATTSAATESGRRAWRMWTAVAVGMALGAGVWLGIVWSRSAGRVGDTPVRKVDLAANRLEIDTGNAPVISPDGTQVVYRAGGALWVRDLDRFDPVALPGSGDTRYPAWSPDSRFVVYARLGENIWKSPADGGTPLVVGPVPADFGGSAGIVWTGDGRIILSGAGGAGLSVMPATGGAAEVLVPIDRAKEADFHEISLMPDGRTVLYVPHLAGGMETIEAYDGTERKTVLRIAGEEIRYPVYAAGHLVFERRRLNTGVWAVRFSADRLETDGSPFLVAAEAGFPSASADGTLAFVRQTEMVRDLVWVDRGGAVMPIASLPSVARTPRLAPDGRRAALLMGPSGDVWTCDLATGALSRLTVDADAIGFAAQWTPDASRLIFGGFMGTPAANLYAVRSDGTGGVTRLTSNEAVHIPTDVTADGRTLVYVQLTDRQQLRRMPIDGSSAGVPIFETPFAEMWASLSPDDRWLAYESNESGRSEIGIRPLEPGPARVPISTEGGTSPEWSADGREIFFWQGTTLMAVPVTIRPTEVVVGRPQPLFSRGLDSGLGAEYDVSADGQRFLFVRQRGNARIALVLNWPLEAAGLSQGPARRAP